MLCSENMTKGVHENCLQILEDLPTEREDLYVAMDPEPTLEELAKKGASQQHFSTSGVLSTVLAKSLKLLPCARLLAKCQRYNSNRSYSNSMR